MTLTYVETLQQELRALKRLRVKQLISGPIFDSGLCCAIGAFEAHASSTGQIEQLGYSCSFRFYPAYDASLDIISQNENFRPEDNKVLSRRLRYRHVLNWVVKQLTILTGERPALADR